MKYFSSFLFFLFCSFNTLLLINSCTPSIHQTTNTEYTHTDTLEWMEVQTDSIYPSKNYVMSLHLFDSNISEVDTIPNTLFIIKIGNEIIFKDSIHNTYQELRFEDFNGDEVKDILIQNTSSARSVWTYTLFLVDTVQNKFKKIKNFENAPWPSYIPKHDLVESYALAGVNWIGFYKIQADTLRTFDIMIEDRLDEDSATFIKKYNLALQQVLQILQHER